MANQKPERIIVIGGGITGLTAAYRLQKSAATSGTAPSLKMLEASGRVGGVISTRQEDGFTLEEGPDCFISIKPWAVALCRELGIESELQSTSPTHRQSFILKRNRLLPVPQGFYLLAPTAILPLARTPIFSWPGKIRMAMELFIPRRKEQGDETLADFVLRRLGREALERMAQPMVAGIYTADPFKLSLKATFPQFLEWEREYGSIIRAMSARRGQGSATSQASGPRYSLFLSFKNGLQTLVDQLAGELADDIIQLNTRVDVIFKGEAAGWKVRLTDGEILEAEKVCLAVPASSAARFLRTVDQELAAELSGIPYLGSITANLTFPRDAVEHPLDGMGFVVPAVENKNLVACSFSSVKFAHRAPEGSVLVRAFIGGPDQQHLLDASDAEVARVVIEDLKPILGLKTGPARVFISKHPNAIAQYHLGHTERVARIEAALANLPGLELAGNAYHGVGIPDCINSAERACQNLLPHSPN